MANNDPISNYYEGLPDDYPQIVDAVTLLEELIDEERQDGNFRRAEQLECALDIINDRLGQPTV